MGLLTSGEPLSWNETQKYAEYVREHGIIQFINVYNRLRDRQDEFLKWGDEVEYMLVRFDHVNQKARLSLKAEPILGEMNEREAQERQKPNATLASLWRPEFGAFMVEGTPGVPYGDLCKDLTKVEDNMRFRRREIEALLEPDEALLCLTSFPRLGTDDFTWPKAKLDPKNSPTGSIFIPDEAIFGGHPRFRTLARNIRQRRKRRVIINIPIFLDEKTPRPFIEQFDDEEAKKAVKENHIYMDHMCFGMGCCCLQVTFQASNLGEARNLYDQLTPLCPILLALSAASPIHRGLISGLDCRWTVIAQSVDDRTKEELNEEPLKDCKFRINKSRYDSVDSYLSEAGEKYSNISLVYDRKYYQKMIEGNVDPIMARHIAHLFIRDPISLYKEKLDQDDTIDMDHFENIQSTNWQTMRFKPPPSSEPNIGWRVEFRPMEIQLTEFENAAFVVFIVLLTRVILTYSLNLLIPLSKVDENMVEAQKEDAINKCRFWFRKDISLKKACEVSEESNDTRNPNIETANSDIDTDHQNDNYMVKMSVDEIINGKPGHFPGLRFFLNKYLLDSQMEAETQCWINQYLNLISFKAAGKAQTTAKWIREFVMNHPDYKKDSVVSDKVNYDLLKEIDAMTKGKVRSRSLLPDEIQIKNSPNSTKFTK